MATRKRRITGVDIHRLLRQYTTMRGHPTFPDWKNLRDRAVIALTMVEGHP